jgi:hypothetical protein
MSTTANDPWALLAEASVEYVGERAIDLELAPGVGVRYAPPGGLTKSDYDFFGIEGWDDGLPTYNLFEALDDGLLTPAPLNLPPPAPPPVRWFHAKHEQPPPEFPYGPLRGTQRDLAAKMYPGRRVDTRRLQRKAGTGASIWVRKKDRTHYEVWFRYEGDYVKVTGNAQAAVM